MVSTASVENIVLVVVDALRADRVGAYGYYPITPNIDRLASEGTIFQYAYSTTNATDPAITSLLTGKYPISHGILNHASKVTEEELSRVGQVTQIQEILSKEGYATYKEGRVLGRWQQNGFDESPDLERGGSDRTTKEKISEVLKRFHPDLQTAARQLYNSSLTIGKMKKYASKADISSQNKNEAAIRFDEFLPTNNPFFTLLHLDDTHVPYNPDRDLVEQYLSDFEYPREPISDVLKRFDDDSWLAKRLPAWVDASWDSRDTAVMQAKYDATVHEADKKIGAVMNHLEETGQLNSTIIFVLSDHGEALGEHDIYYDHHGLYDPTIRIPLIVRTPFNQERERDEFVQIFDVAPTIFDVLKLDRSLDTDGQSLLPLLTGNNQDWVSRQCIVAEEHYTQDRRAIRTRDYKYIEPAGKTLVCRYCKKRHTSNYELYSLKEDPKEKQNVFEEQPKVAEKLKNLLKDELNQYSPPESGDTRLGYEDEEAMKEHMRDLGYI